MSEHLSGGPRGRHVVEHQVPERIFETPTWVRPPRPREGEPTLPVQAVPTHDRLDVPPPAPLLEHATWSAPHTLRRVSGALLVMAGLTVLATGTDAVVAHSSTSATIALFSLLAGFAIYAGMAATRPMTVELDGSKLVVDRRRGLEVFDLIDPFQDVVERGEPGTTTWSLALATPGGGSVLIDARTVDSLELHPVIVRARERAARSRVERDERFNR